MKPIKITVKGKTLKLKTEAVIIIAAAILTILLGVIVIVNLFHKEAPVEEETEEKTVEVKKEETVINVEEYDGTILAKTDDAGQEYIDSTLFLGDSNTARFLAVRDENGKTFTTVNNSIGVVGMGIDAISSLPCVDFVSGRYTMVQAVKMIQPQRIIIMMGTNNLYGSDTDATSFITRYEAQIKKIEEAYPYADIIVNAIPPVTQKTTYLNVKIVQIDAYNKAIVQMCEKNDWKFLNNSEALKDNTGYAKPEYMADDGLHLSQKGLIELFKYIRTHAYETEDERPKPLADCPKIIGVPAGLIKTNPLDNKEFTENPAEPEVTEPVQEEVKQIACGVGEVNDPNNAEKCICDKANGYISFGGKCVKKAICSEEQVYNEQTNACDVKPVEEQPQEQPEPQPEPQPDPQPEPQPQPDPQPEPSEPVVTPDPPADPQPETPPQEPDPQVVEGATE